MAKDVSIDPLIKKIKKYNPGADLDIVRLAFEYAEAAHEGHTRKDGCPYIAHPVKTAETLADMKLPIPIIVASLLHDVPEDTSVDLADIEKYFGEDIASMVGGITKLGKIKYRGIERYVENLRKMFISIASDLRVILIKFADRLHNLQTLSALPPDKRKRIALESLEIYAPIAGRLGMNEIKSKMEDIAFKYAMPKEYEWVSGLSEKIIKVRKEYIDEIKTVVEEDLKKAGIKYISIQGRMKQLYSLYKKLLKYERDIVQIHDIIALRIIVPTVGDCYATLGIIHQRWHPLRERIKDYLSQPKPNGYQSLHTTVFCQDKEIVEFQIRTEKMHEEAEFGIAAHWHYDEKGKAPSEVEKRLEWVKDLGERQKTKIKSAGDYLSSLEILKIDVFQDHIFVFTPKGDVIDLPEGATPIDFAYAIHSDIGNTCVGARVNDHIVGLDTKLSSGDCCDIIVDKNRKGPNPDWIKFVKTNAAKSHIKLRSKSKLTKWISDLTKQEKGSGKESKK